MSTTWDESRVTHHYADLEHVRLHYVEAGSGPLVVLLHGFPGFWYSWRYQIVPLIESGFRVVAPDLRGYNLSDKPREVRAYAATEVARDIYQLIKACGADPASVIGHDWGGFVSWYVAMGYPQAVERLVVMNVPHPVSSVRALRSPLQVAKSSYMIASQLPRVPEAAVRAGNFALIRQLLRRDPVRPNAFSEEDIERYVEALKRPGALTSAFNYYRALFRQDPRRVRSDIRRIEAPVLVIWGERDRYLGELMVEPPREWVPNARIERLADASHWVQEDRPEEVNALLHAFLVGEDRGG